MFVPNVNLYGVRTMAMIFVKPGPKKGNWASIQAEITDLCTAYGAGKNFYLQTARGYVLIENIPDSIEPTHLRTGLEAQGFQVCIVEVQSTIEGEVKSTFAYIREPKDETQGKYDWCIETLARKHLTSSEEKD